MRLKDAAALDAILARPGYGAREQSARAAQPSIEPPPASKFGNEKTAGYDSKREASRGAELALMAHAGEILNLRRQVKFVLIPKQYVDGQFVERACSYFADFVYERGGAMIVEDVKGYANDTYPIKRKLMLHVHGIRIVEI